MHSRATGVLKTWGLMLYCVKPMVCDVLVRVINVQEKVTWMSQITLLKYFIVSQKIKLLHSLTEK